MSEAREDMLVSRAIDGELNEPQWHEFQAMADVNPLLWRRLACAQRDHAALMCATAEASDVAEQIECPAATLHHSDDVTQIRLNRFGAWTGWAVAAMVAIIASVHWAQPQHMAPAPEQTQVAGVSFDSAADAFKAYLERGRESGVVVGEVPEKVLIDTQPMVSGNGYEVIYLRQVMERAVVTDLYHVAGENEVGQPTLVRFEPTARGSL